VEMMKGNIEVLSEGPETGSTFFFGVNFRVVPEALENKWRSMNVHECLPNTNVAVLTKSDLLYQMLEKRLLVAYLKPTRVTSVAQMSDFTVSTAPALILHDYDVFQEPTYKSALPTSAIILIGSGYLGSGPVVGMPFVRKPVQDNSLVQTILEVFGGHDASAPNVLSPGTAVASPRQSNIDTSLHVLIAEDNLMNQKVLARILEKLGMHHIQIVKNGQEALDIIDEFNPDIIFMDRCMPQMSGEEATRKIRAKYGPTGPYIVAVTADVFPEDCQKCLQAGMNMFLTKPVRMDPVKSALVMSQRVSMNVEQ